MCYYNIACYYLDSDESRFNLELGIDYFDKYKESEQDWEKCDNENNNLKKIIEEHKDKWCPNFWASLPIKYN